MALTRRISSAYASSVVSGMDRSALRTPPRPGRRQCGRDLWPRRAIDPDILVLANPEIARLPPWVVALVAAGALGAALSTAAGLLLVIAAGVSHDLLKSVLYPRMDDRTELWACSGWLMKAAEASESAARWLPANNSERIAGSAALAPG